MNQNEGVLTCMPFIWLLKMDLSHYSYCYSHKTKNKETKSLLLNMTLVYYFTVFNLDTEITPTVIAYEMDGEQSF